MQQSKNYLNASYVRLPVLPQLFSAQWGLHDQFSPLQITLAVLWQKPSKGAMGIQLTGSIWEALHAVFMDLIQ